MRCILKPCLNEVVSKQGGEDPWRGTGFCAGRMNKDNDFHFNF